MNRFNRWTSTALLLAVTACAHERVRSLTEVEAELKSQRVDPAKEAAAKAEKARAEAAAAAAQAAEKAKAEASALAARLKAEADAAALALLKGPTVLALPASNKAAVSIQLRFRTGSVDDPQGKAGITQLAARVMTEGGAGELSATQLLTALFPIAADLDVRVDMEETTFSAKVHQGALEKLLPILTDVLLKPRWEQKEFDRLREAQLNDVEKRLRQGDDENLGKAALASLLYRGHPYGRLGEGHLTDLKSITLEEARAHAARVFTADRLTIGVAGGYPQDLPERLSKALAALPAKGAAPVGVYQQPAPAKVHFLLVEKPGASTAVSMGLPYGLSHASPEWPALSIARSAMGEHRQFNGRLMQRLRELRGLNYGDYAYLEQFQQEGGDAATAQTGRARHQQQFSVWLRPMQNENRLFAVKAALFELRRSLAEEPFSDAEVAQTKGFLDGYLLLFDQNDTRKLGYALDDDFYGQKGFLASWRAALGAVDTAAVNAAWRRFIDPSKLQIVMVGPEMQKVKQALLSGEATPIHYQNPDLKRPQAQLDADAAIAAQKLDLTDADIEIVPVEKMFE